METSKENLKKLHTEHINWMAQLNLFIDELKSFEGTLGEVAVKNSSADKRKQVEHFQNQFILQKEKLDELRHDVQAAEGEISRQVMSNPVAWQHQSKESEAVLRDRMQSFDRLFSELKQEYRQFLQQSL